jgi:hypothetical protein
LEQQQDNSADIDRFNQMVDTYNLACGEKWVKTKETAAIEAIRGEVNANRDALWAEGAARFQRR